MIMLEGTKKAITFYIQTQSAVQKTLSTKLVGFTRKFQILDSTCPFRPDNLFIVLAKTFLHKILGQIV